MFDAVITVKLDNLNGSALEYMQNHPVEIMRGKSIRFSIKNNASTDQTWQYESTKESDELFSVKKTYKTDNRASGRDGAPGTAIFTVTADDEMTG